MPEMREFIDISPEISASSAVFPGDTPFRRDVALDIGRGDHLALSSITTTVHIGAHVDAPSHYHRDGQTISERSLNYYFGPCQVITIALPRGERIRPEHIAELDVRAPRVLFKTGSFPDPSSWNGDFNSLSSDLVELLHAHGVKLVGIDTPSIDPADDKTLESHNAVERHDMAVLEGITLEHANDGLYTLVALPLKLKGADASPVRAILWKS